ncbi:NEDD4-binding protein 3 isoform X2 [Ursus maritimus]|uniref:NEDD4-binding protein 3 isoform X2 n=1 Tax=Ursus maritimus TaxID=29073 RepID=A0A8M1F592_URSMA|nr:NEDD4-binding protein 3 isoform X2 [Ursus maritimus]
MATAPGPAGIAMGSVGSLLERQDFSPEELRAALAGSRTSRQPDGLLRKGLGQRELFSYLHLPKRDGKNTKRAPRNEPADYTTLYYREHPRAGDFSKTSLPERGRFDKCRIRPSVFKPVASAGKGFLSMQSLAAHKGQKLWRSNGSLHTLACHPPLSPGPRASQAQARAQLLHALSLDEGGPEPEPSLSDSSSGGSFGRSPGTGPGPFSSSMGHINHLGGSLDRASRVPKEAGPLAMLSCLPEPPPPYEFSCPTAEEVVAVLPDTCEDLKRGLGDEDGSNPFTQVLEERQRLWLAELKRLYVERLHEVAQKAERSERNLQLQLFMAQQEQRRLRKELRAQQGLGPEPRPPGALPEADPSTRPEEEARWEVSDRASYEPSVPFAACVPPSAASPPLTRSCASCAPPGVPEDRGDQPPEAAAAGGAGGAGTEAGRDLQPEDAAAGQPGAGAGAGRGAGPAARGGAEPAGAGPAGRSPGRL